MNLSKLSDIKWQRVPSLGPDWLGKWDFSVSGYQVLITDGCEFWEEEREPSYIAEKAEAWAACLDTEIESLGFLIGGQLAAKSSTITVFEKTSHQLILKLKSSIESLPFRWEFHLQPLSSKKIRQCWLRPIAATLEQYSYKIDKLEEELKKRERQLEEFQAPLPHKKEDGISQYTMDASISNTMKTPFTVLLSEHLAKSSDFIKRMNKMEIQQIPRDSPASSYAGHGSPLKRQIRRGVEHEPADPQGVQVKDTPDCKKSPVTEEPSKEPDSKSVDENRKKKKRRIAF